MKKIFLFLSVLLSLAGTPAMALVITPDIGPTFEAAVDIGPTRGIGSTMYQGQNTYAGQTMDEYFITAGGADIWGSADQFHYAYKTVSGDVRMWMGYKYQAWDNDWVKAGPMFRDGLANNAIHYMSTARRGPWDATNLRWSQDRVAFQGRQTTGGSSGSFGAEYLKPAGVEKPVFLGLQRVTYKGLPFFEAMVDWGQGAGWERSGNLQLGINMPNEVKLGVAITGHREWSMSQTWVYGAQYEQNPSLIGPAPTFPVVDNPIPECPLYRPGFRIHTIKAPAGMTLNWAAMDDLLDDDMIGPFPGIEAGTRIEPVVNLYDSENNGRGVFANDQSYPGIDPFEQQTQDPAGGDGDDQFATEVRACIELTQGLHIIGVNSDDGAYIKIGGVEIGRTAEGKGVSNVDFVFEIVTAGKYLLQVRNLEMTGGAALELHEIINIGGVWTRILLGDVAAGGSPVYVPEPATIVLLGLGALSLIRRK
jgi:hypothetical protein